MALRVLQCMVGMNRGGLETLTMNLYRHLDRDAVQFDFLVSKEGEFDEEIRSLGGRIFRIPFIDRSGPFRYAADLRMFFRAHPQYRIVHIQMDRFGGMLAREAKIEGVPVRILHSHSTRNEGSLLVRAVKNHYARSIDDATHLFACSETAGTWMFGKRPFSIIRNGVDLSVFRAADTRREGEFAVGHVGRFVKAKNHPFLIRIFAHLVRKNPKAKLYLAGSGEGQLAARQQVKRLGLEKQIVFLNEVRDVPGFLASLDVFCMPSLFEGHPLSLVEAEAVGVPIVLSDAVDPAVDLTSSMTFLPLSCGEEKWAEALLQQLGKARKDNREVLKNKGFSIEETAKRLQTFYLDAANASF